MPPPPPRGPGRPAWPRLAPSPRPSGSSNPLRSAGRAGQGRGLGAAGPRSYSESCPGFPPPSRSAPPRTHSENPLPGFLAPRGRSIGFLWTGKGWVGQGLSWVWRLLATLLSDPLPLLKYRHLRTPRTALRKTVVALLKGPSQSPRQQLRIFQTGGLSAKDGHELVQGHPQVAEPDQTPVSYSLRPHYSTLSLQGSILCPRLGPTLWAMGRSLQHLTAPSTPPSASHFPGHPASPPPHPL